MRSTSIALAALALIIVSACATTQAPESENACLTPLPLTATLVRESGVYDFSAFTGASAMAPTFISGALSPTRDTEEAQDMHGSVVFIRGADGAWRAAMPMNGENIVGMFASAAGEMVIVTMWQVEGPGQSWTLLRSTDGLASATCTEVAFPSTLNQPTWANEMLSLTDLDITDRGEGEIVGVARTDAEAELWYAYRTRNDGASWSAPRRISQRRDAVQGRFERLTRSVAPPELAAELRVYTEGR